ncbi:AraC family transcriptional regulator [Arthrobacter sp. ISL-95]|uniref:helix-turn-helix domain-containing protein n=1 Tax=Arthrobacter sp. ISL-95 TaxID=2819116 RepID=UPI001BE71DA3|nr:helix-turn-helix transcriptional regulator [Arthrobacter sp. ISL-95]
MLEVALPGTVPRLDDTIPCTAKRTVAYVRAVWSSGGLRVVPIKEIAEALNISSGHVSRSFRDCFGLGPAGGLEIVRLTQAAIALQRTSSTLGEIAAGCGFDDEYHLSRRFSRIYGSPRCEDPLDSVKASGRPCTRVVGTHFLSPVRSPTTCLPHSAPSVMPRQPKAG